MNLKDKKNIIKLYESRYESAGYDVSTVGWRDIDQQNMRFEVLTDRFDLNGKSVCDIGCGFGDLFPYLQKKFKKVKYVGVDITPGLIDEAKRRYPGGEFLSADALSSQFKGRFDYCFLSGALNLRISDNIGNAKKMIRKMFAMSRRSIAFNMLSSYVDYTNRINFHYNPEEFFKFAKSLSRFVTLRHDYPLWEFTIYISKDYVYKI